MSKHYLVGHPGVGKTAALVARFTELIGSGVRPDRILVLVPQESHAQRFKSALAPARSAASAPHEERRLRRAPEIHTFFGLAQQHVSLFFPRIAPRAGFANPYREPVWMNVEAAQYLLERLMSPRMAEFEDLRMSRTRLLIQILDNLNRAATTGFPLEDLARRLASAWHGSEPRERAYRAAQDVALDFRRFCLQHTLVDFSLGMELFATHLLAADFYREYVAARYRHVLADNIEEAAPIIHDLLRLLLETSESAMLVEDDPGGFRVSLGASPQSARSLRAMCQVMPVPDPRLQPDAPDSPARFGQTLMRVIIERESRIPLRSAAVEKLYGGDVPTRYWASMVQTVADRIGTLVCSGAQAHEIAVVAPVVEDVLRFELEERLKRYGVGLRVVRPSRPLYDQPLVRALVTLARLGHPDWEQPASPQELAHALALVIAGLDVVRAQLIADAARRACGATGILALPVLDEAALWDRVGATFRGPYDALRDWLTAWVVAHRARAAPLDVFWRGLMAEVLSQPGFVQSEDAAAWLACDKLIASARAFREVFEQADLASSAGDEAFHESEMSVLGLSAKPSDGKVDVGRAYIAALAQSTLAAEYVPERAPDVSGGGVLLTPAYTYLTGEYRSRYQFWLDVNALSWHERFYQPLTHPYVLSRDWAPGRRWTDEDEQRASRDLLARVMGGLAFRCRDKIYLAASELNVAGQEERGMLARALRDL
ncbi:MAG: AAA family ATPase [Anaerolineae bacterium]|nr:AAA family ATPase [Anaerolineae bacterium]